MNKITSANIYRNSGNYTNKTDEFLVILGYTGSYTVLDPNGNEISGMASGIPYAIVAPNCTLSGGTRFWGVFIADLAVIL